jgi:hypothetical protein
MGIVIGALVFVGGLVGLILGASTGALHPAAAVGLFVAAVVVAGVVLVLGKALSELIRLLADMGDRTRHVTLMIEDTFAQNHLDNT